jgi:thiol-disulfide isomerase/thioredoxin
MVLRAAVVIGFVIGCATFVASFSSEPAKSETASRVAPEFALKDADGKTVRLSDYRGKVVLLDFWATWCGPCRVSLPHLNELSENKELTDKGLKVYAVNLKEDKETAKGYADQNKLTFAIPLDLKGAVAEKYLVRGIPTTVVVGRDGKIAKVLVGSGKNAELDSAVNDALAAENPRKAAKSG